MRTIKINHIISIVGWLCAFVSLHVKAQDFNEFPIDTLVNVDIVSSYVAEINNDHYPDIIHVIQSDSQYHALIYLQTDSLVFQLADTIKDLAFPFISFTDINNSGQIDLLFGEKTNEQYQLVASMDYDSSGNFTPLSIIQSDSIISVLFSDFENNSLKDIYLVSNVGGQNNLNVIQQAGPLDFQLDTIFFNVDNMMQLTINRDGWSDLAFYNEKSNQILFLQQIPFEPLQWDTLILEIDFPIKEWVMSDIISDGHSDIVALSETNGNSTFYLIENSYPGFIIEKITETTEKVDFFTSADIDNDGWYEVLYSAAGVQHLVYWHPEKQMFDNDTLSIVNGFATSQVGDLDDNGILDLIGKKTDQDSVTLSFILNFSNEKNTGPFFVPLNFPVTAGNQTAFSWNLTTDDKTVTNSLTYDFFLETFDSLNFLFTSDYDLTNSKRFGFRNTKRHGDRLFDLSYTVRDLPSGKYLWGVAGVDNSFHSSTNIRDCSGGSCDGEKFYFTQCLDLTTEETFACINDTLNLSIGEPGDSVAWFSKKQGLLGNDNALSFVVAEDDTIYAIAIPRVKCEELSDACMKNYSLSIETIENKNLLEESEIYLCRNLSQIVTVEGDFTEITWYNEDGIISTSAELEINTDLIPVIFLKAKETGNQCSYFDTLFLIPLDSIKIDLFPIETEVVCLNTIFYPEINIPDSLADKISFRLISGSREIDDEGMVITSQTEIVAKGIYENCHTFFDTLDVTPKDPPQIIVTGNNQVFPGKTTQLTASGANTYQWAPTTFLSSPTSASTIVQPTNSLDYVVTGWDEDGCEGTTSFGVEVIPSVYIPELFTPNEDGNNDRLLVYGNEVKQLNFSLFDGNGRKVYSTSSVPEITQNGWDGTKNGSRVASGTYIWTIEGEFNNGTPLTFEGKTKGEIKIVR